MARKRYCIHGLALAATVAVPVAVRAQEAAASAAAPAASAVTTATPPVLAALEGGQISVRMSGHVDDEFAREVERDWLPVMREAAGRFDRLVRETMRARLHKPVRAYLAAGKADYETVLAKDMKVTAAMAQRYAHATGGLSNQNGQIAVHLTPAMGRGARFNSVVVGTLHELTHALQSQLAFGYYGFQPPRWLTEGSADLIAATLAERVELKGVSVRTFKRWRETNLAWWQQDNRSALTPEHLVDKPDGREWLDMTAARRGNYRLAGLMVAHLQDMLGEEAFYRAWVRLYISAGDTAYNERPDKGFERAFGMTEKAFLADFRRWLDTQPVTSPAPAPAAATEADKAGALP